MTQPNDMALVESAQKGDREAFRRLLERHYAMMYRVAYRFTGHVQDAEDVAQDVCLGLVHKLAAFRGESGFTTWLYRVVVNTCRDLHKKRATHRALEKTYAEMEECVQADQREAKYRIAWLYRAVAALEQDLKETALLVLAEELSHAETGKILGCAESTISWRMHEIRKLLKQAAEAEGHDG